MTNTDRIRYITAGLAIAGTVLAIGSTLTGIPGLPGWLVSSWPIVYGVALAFDRVAHILWPDVAPPAASSEQTNQGFPPQTNARSIEEALREPVSLSSDVLHETPDRVIDNTHAIAAAVIEAQAGRKS